MTFMITDHNPVRVIAFMGCHLCSNRKALYTQVKIWAHGTLNTNFPRDVFITVIAVIQSLFSFTCSLAWHTRKPVKLC